MFAKDIHTLELSHKHRACCRRADIVNAAQLVLAQSQEVIKLKTLLGEEEAEHVQHVATVDVAPCSQTVWEMLEPWKDDDRLFDFPIGNECRDGIQEGEREARDPSYSGLTTTRRRSSFQNESQSHPLALHHNRKEFDEMYSLSTGDQALDQLLGGGMQKGCLTEIVGQSSSGKTQILLQTAMCAALGLCPLSTTSEEKETRSWEQTYDPAKSQSRLHKLLRGNGMRQDGKACSVVLLSPDGEGAGQMMTRRMTEMCQAAITTRWLQMRERKKRLEARRAKRARRNGGGNEEEEEEEEGEGDHYPSSPRSQAGGRFREPDDQETQSTELADLEMTRQAAKVQLLRNVHVAGPTDYDSLDHIISYNLPALAERIVHPSNGTTRNGKSNPLGLVIIDDLPAMIHGPESSLEPSTSSTTTGEMQRAVRRSQMICEMSDKLRRLASYCGEVGEEQAAIVIGNHVVDSFERARQLAIPALRSIWEERLVEREGEVEKAIDGREGKCYDEPPLESSQQELYFSGILSSAHPKLLALARSRKAFQGGLSSTSAPPSSVLPDHPSLSYSSYTRRLFPEDEVWEGICSGLKMAALGYSWVNCINVRVMLHRTARKRSKTQVHRVVMEDIHDPTTLAMKAPLEVKSKAGAMNGESREKVHLRRAVVVKSPFAPAGERYNPSIEYVILKEGVMTLPTRATGAVTEKGGLGENDGDDGDDGDDGNDGDDRGDESPSEVEQAWNRGAGLEGEQFWSFLDDDFDEAQLATMDVEGELEEGDAIGDHGDSQGYQALRNRASFKIEEEEEWKHHV